MTSGYDASAATEVLAAITRKRAGEALSPESITTVVDGFVRGQIPPYQMAAWLATIACCGMSFDETVALTRSYVMSGAQLSLRDVIPRVVDKHSTGGVGDKVSLVVAPIVAACGVPVGKVTGRGLGFAGGTVDKLQSIKGLRVELGAAEMTSVLRTVGMVITGQSDDLVPADRDIYALRDVTATVDSFPLIAASVMSKKVAVGATGVVLDVKYGSGAVVPSRSDAEELARLMIAVGESFDTRCRAVLSDMSQPLGYAIGNALEVREAIDFLGGQSVPGLDKLSHDISRLMVQIAFPHLNDEEASDRVSGALQSGAALQKFRQWVEAQGGDPRQIDEPALLPRATHQHFVRSPGNGWVSAVDARTLGEAAMHLGAGRFFQHDLLDSSAGIVLRRRVGDYVEAGDPLAEVHHNGNASLARACDSISAAVRLSSSRTTPSPVVDCIL